MSKVFNNIHIEDDEYNYSLGGGLYAIRSSGLLKNLGNKKKSTGEKVWDETKNLAGAAVKVGSNIASNVSSKVADSAIGKVISDAIDKSESKIVDKFTANGRAKVNLENLLHPQNNNGIDIGTKLELTKLNTKLRVSGVPEKHLEKATLLYISALEASGDKDLAKQFYLTKLRDCGVSGEHILKCVKISLGPQATEWIKAAAVIGLVVAGTSLVTKTLASKGAITGAVNLLGGATRLAGGLLGGATRLATGVLSNAVKIVR